MSETRADIVTVDIDKMLNRPLSSAPSKPSMFRVGDELRSINPVAYDPRIIAIGPFHHRTPHLRNMQQHKVRYLKLLLERRKESSVERYVTEIRRLEDKARKCYAEDIGIDEDEFVKMLILDGCFIVEFLLKKGRQKYLDQDDPIFQYAHIRNHLLHDLLVFENQIPFFVVDRLFKMITDGDPIKCIIWPLVRYLIFPVPLKDFLEVPINEHHVHLLGIVHDIQCSSFAKKLSKMNSGNPNNMVNSGEECKEAGSSSKKSEGDRFFHECCSFTKILSKMNSRNPNNMVNINSGEEQVNINSAEELTEAGISFKKLKKAKGLFDIEFENKIMKIPEWKIFDDTESLFRNLIAYEHYLTGSRQKLVTDYVFFMHCLVNSPEDAKLLRLSGIIGNHLGGDEMVYRVINQLHTNIFISKKFSYSKIYDNVNDHCGHKRNRWMAKLRREYFNSPWAFISVLAAIILLVLTIIQTIFAILSFLNDFKRN